MTTGQKIARIVFRVGGPIVCAAIVIAFARGDGPAAVAFLVGLLAMFWGFNHLMGTR